VVLPRLALEQEDEGGLADLDLALVASGGEVKDAADDAPVAVGARGVVCGVDRRAVGDSLAQERQGEVDAERLALGGEVAGDRPAGRALR
jgi:hypothetical protein